MEDKKIKAKYRFKDTLVRLELIERRGLWISWGDVRTRVPGFYSTWRI